MVEKGRKGPNIKIGLPKKTKEEEKNKNGGEKKSSQPKTERGKAKKGGAGAAKGLRLKWIKKENNATMTKAGRYGKNKEDAERP